MQPPATWDTAAVIVRRHSLGYRSFSLHCTTLVSHRSHPHKIRRTLSGPHRLNAAVFDVRIYIVQKGLM